MKTHRLFTIRSLFTGLLFVAAGVLLLMFDSGVLPIEHKRIIFSWKMLACVIGFLCLLSARKFFIGVILILIGGLFILFELNFESLSFLKVNIWALLIIIVGLNVAIFPIWRRQRFNKWRQRTERIKNLSSEQRFELFDRYRQLHHCRDFPAGAPFFYRFRHRCHNSKKKNTAGRPGASKSGYVEYNSVFSGLHEKISVKNFRGGEINCIFGGAELDFSEAQLDEGVHTLEINTVFGGVLLYVPVDWRVELRQDQMFGRFVDRRPKPTFEVDEKKTLILEVTAVFGGGEVKLKPD
ncbi:MAG: cell wall-active antibiotics response protein [Prevotellaceae bacterium]|jgi:predicted membrane protein|nr:cell wall-active antibiotics response protein [Prevotellaceae bacterium]